MSSKYGARRGVAGGQPTLNYYPTELCSPYYSPRNCGNNGCGGGGEKGAVIAASMVLIILLIFVVVGGIWYWSYNGNSKTDVDINVVKKKQVSFGESSNHAKQLLECPEKLLMEIMAGKSEPVVIVFVAPWCGICTALKPTLEEAAKKSNLPIYTLTHVDNQKTPLVGKAAEHLKVGGFPTLFRVENGKAKTYSGDRSQTSLVEFSK